MKFRSTEQADFAALLGKHMALQDAPLLLEGGTGIGKTRAYLHAVVMSGHRVALVLPTHQLIDQLLASADLAAVGLDVVDFRPAAMFDKRADYEARRAAAQAARVMVCTSAAVIIDQRLRGEYCGALGRDYLVFDEADQLPEMAALQSDMRITRAALSEAGIAFTDVPDTLRRVADAPARVIDPEMRAAARVMLEVLEDPQPWQRVGVEDDGTVALSHRLPGRLLTKVANRAGVAFVSATLTVSERFDNFRNVMGIGEISRLSCAIEPRQHGHLQFQLHALEVGTQEWFDATVEAIEDAPRPTLVATTSHELTARLLAAVGARDDVLIKAGAWAGLDVPVPWRSIVVPTVPFGQPVVLDGEVVSSYLDARTMAQRRLRQVIGRGLRSPDAACTIIMLDQRASKVGQFVPARFLEAWGSRTEFDEGQRAEVVLSKAERDPNLRNAALKHYGTRCRWEGCDITQKHLLDVHHLDPIAEGVRKTTLKDVTVLCKNHHAEAHHQLRQQARGVSRATSGAELD
ncbi:DEAD/DEAH box helicase [Pelomonas sp. UHG3]|uniref:DEAD/DEAH box helicase n=1 Tax=Roseateles hydrophilus TaxID=2975054 RepID=A0ACC6CDF7_9BURK|nr:DEAD/DEAH box helicase [Pelomonas sp. UHG3]MCY4746448.1 DEAD/DEAH box helicase [Pelomonas sp. UHG3]